MDNGISTIAVLDWLEKKYHLNHIWISAYNNQANGFIECSHHSICKSIVKPCNSDISCWPEVMLYLFGADRLQCDVTWDSSFYMTHGVHPILPFDIAEATFLIPKHWRHRKVFGQEKL